jgi:DNA polymerase I-like protein with 3'-5' exonuclease and polymerase domains
VHATTARHLFGLPFDAKVSAAQRTAAKAIKEARRI